MNNKSVIENISVCPIDNKNKRMVLFQFSNTEFVSFEVNVKEDSIISLQDKLYKAIEEMNEILLKRNLKSKESENDTNRG
jgi:hypothetical protein